MGILKKIKETLWLKEHPKTIDGHRYRVKNLNIDKAEHLVSLYKRLKYDLGYYYDSPKDWGFKIFKHFGYGLFTNNPDYHHSQIRYNEDVIKVIITYYENELLRIKQELDDMGVEVL